MVVQQAIRVEPEPEPLAVPLQPLQIGLPVPVVAEDSLALVAAPDDVVNGAFSLQPPAAADEPWLSIIQERTVDPKNPTNGSLWRTGFPSAYP
jgi:hypothetical protein